MWQDVLIIALGLCTLILSVLLWRRHRTEKGLVNLRREAVDGLIRAFEANGRTGNIQNIAGQVSDILKQHMACQRIVYLKNYHENLELNYFSGLKIPPRHFFRMQLTRAIQDGLRQFSAAEDISELKNILGDDYAKKIQGLGLNLFFPVFSRDRFYGLYLIHTDLDKKNRIVQLLTSALALNLATAYHIYFQEKTIKISENRIKRVGRTTSGDGTSIVARNLPSILRIKDSRRLAAELVDMLRKECDFSRMFFYAGSSGSRDSFISFDWNLDDRGKAALRETLLKSGSGWEGSKIRAVKDDSELPPSLKSAADTMRQNKIDFVTTMPWTDGVRALIGWSSKNKPDEIEDKLDRFRRDARPIIENIHRLEQAEELSYTDGLTEVHNYRFFRSRLEEEIGRAKRYPHPIALLIMDIDSLKTINDRFGHQAGDRLLISFAQMLTESVRAIDVVSRYGGDEFCLILPETDKDNTHHFMERLRQKIASSPVSLKDVPEEIFYSVSIGGAVFPTDAKTGEDLVHSADLALLDAKASGRNCSQMFEPEMSPPSSPG